MCLPLCSSCCLGFLFGSHWTQCLQEPALVSSCLRNGEDLSRQRSLRRLGSAFLELPALGKMVCSSSAVLWGGVGLLCRSCCGRDSCPPGDPLQRVEDRTHDLCGVLWREEDGGGFFTESMKKKIAYWGQAAKGRESLCEASECYKSISVAMMDDLDLVRSYVLYWSAIEGNDMSRRVGQDFSKVSTRKGLCFPRSYNSAFYDNSDDRLTKFAFKNQLFH